MALKEVGISGEAIRSARLARGMTQHDLALAVGSRDRDVQRWEHDLNAPSARYLLALLRTLPELNNPDGDLDKRALFNGSIPSDLRVADLLPVPA